MTDPADRIIEKAKRVGEGSLPDPDRDLGPLSHDLRDDRDDATQWVEKVEFRAPIGYGGEPEPDPIDEEKIQQRLRQFEDTLDQFDW